jgi:predicted acyltransferase
MSTATIVNPELSEARGGILEYAAPETPNATSTRLVSMDAYRGFVMFLMASGGLKIADWVGNTHASELWQKIAMQTDHVEWRGCALWDLIQPSFTFLVGVALPFSLAKRSAQGQSFGRMLFHAIVRSVILIYLGIFLRSQGRKIPNFTFEDTLTQIGLGYTFAFLLAWTKPKWQAIALGVILFGYWLAFVVYPLPPAGFDTTSVGVPANWKYNLTGFAAHWNKNTNLAHRADVWFMKLFPRQSEFKFNGGGYQTLSFIPTLGTMILGLLAGNLVRGPLPAMKKIGVLVIAGVVGLGMGKLLDITGICPSVKRIWTPSWVLFSGGWCCLLLALFYAIIDVAKVRFWAFPLVVIGMNSIAMYVMADSGFHSWVRDGFQTHLGWLFRKTIYEPIAISAATLLVLWLVLYWMYRRKIFLRI